MADYGLLGGVAEGFNRGLKGFQDERRHQEKKKLEEDEIAMRRKAFAADLIGKGLAETPAGSFERTPEYAQEKAFDRLEKSAGLLKSGYKPGAYDSESKSYALEETPDIAISRQGKQALTRKAIAEATLAERKAKGGFSDPDDEYKSLRTQKMRQEVGQGGVRLPPDKLLLMKEGEAIPAQLEEIKNVIAGNGKIMGPIKGRFGSMNAYNQPAQVFEAKTRATAQAFGRYMEGGVLRKEDEEKYQKMFPNIRDNPKVAADKLAIVSRLLMQKHNANLQGLSGGGYSISGLNEFKEIPEVPESIGGEAQNDFPQQRMVKAFKPDGTFDMIPESLAMELGYGRK